MLDISKERLENIKKSFEGKRIAVIGDMMLDSYFCGKVKRISPEAPVPVVEIDNEFYRFGGAANVALNLHELRTEPFPIGVIGKDNEGKIFNSLLKNADLTDEGIIIDDSRPTTSKTRVIAHNQHVVRIDKESKESVNEEIEKKIFEIFKANVQNLDAVILQDYNKGVLTKSLIRKVIELANENGVIVTVDPKFDNFFEYKNVTVFKPNRKETEDAFGAKISNQEEINHYGKELLKRLNSKYVLLTLGEEGVALFGDGTDVKKMPTKARKVADVSGAGDTVISTLTVALTAGANIYEAAYLANFAGGLVCEEVGIVPIGIEKLFAEVIEEMK